MWEEEPEWRSLAMAGTQLYIERVVWEHLVLEEAAEAPGTTFTCFTSTKVQILTWIVHKVHCCWRKHSLTGKRSQNGEDWQWLARRSCPSLYYICVSHEYTQ